MSWTQGIIDRLSIKDIYLKAMEKHHAPNRVAVISYFADERPTFLVHYEDPGGHYLGAVKITSENLYKALIE